MMIELALYEPEIPPNTGNIIRLCANTGSTLHLIHPLGFAWDDKRVQRAGLDYHELTSVKHHTNFEAFLTTINKQRLFAFSTKGSRNYTDVHYQGNDILLFGPETRGLPSELLTRIGTDYVLRIPMLEHSRSLNLSNAAAIALYEAWRQLGFNQR